MKIISLEKVLNKSILLSSLFIVTISCVITYYVVSLNFQNNLNEIRKSHLQTLGKQVIPSLSISNYSGVKSILGQAEDQKKSNIGVFTSDGDILLSNYNHFPLFKEILTNSDFEITCAAEKSSKVFSTTSQAIFLCRKLVQVDYLAKSERLLGYIIGIYNSNSAGMPFHILYSFLLSTLGIIFIYAFFFRRAIKKNIIRPLVNITKSIKEKADNPLREDDDSEHIDHKNILEFLELKNSFSNLISAFRREHKNAQNALKLATFVQIAAQVAHDIRSPLAALKMMTAELKGVEEDRRTLIRSAVQRIDDIANDLAGKKARKEIAEGAHDEKTRVELLSALIDSLISEKRMQFRSKLNVKIEADLDVNAYGLFGKIQPVAFKRVLSNLVNNAVEAFGGDAGRVSVSLRGTLHQHGAGRGSNPEMSLHSGLPRPRDTGARNDACVRDDRVAISVTDTGKGIPPEILPKLMQKGATFGKENSKTSGSGLGLYHARTMVEGWGGEMKIESEVGKGSVVAITLPKEEAPDWFVSRIDVAEDATVVVIDDDDSIHHVWRERFDGIHFKRENMFHFSSPEDVEFWHKAYHTRPDVLYLFDYELLGSEITGLDVIEKLGIGNNSILVTSHYEEEDIRARCKKLGVRLLPKNLAGFVPIVVDDAVGVDFKSTRYDRAGLKPAPTNFSTDIVLIDDDEMVRTMWKVEARTKGKNLIALPSPEEFFAKEKDFDKDISIYIDSNLSDGLKGEDIARDIHQKGFTRIYLATGTDKQDFPPMPWIKDIVGKEVPF